MVDRDARPCSAGFAESGGQRGRSSSAGRTTEDAKGPDRCIRARYRGCVAAFIGLCQWCHKEISLTTM
jgi:hypothetical protein